MVCRIRSFVRGLVVVAAAFAPASHARATPSHLFSTGGESQALGKTGVSGASDFGAVLLNPAALGGRGTRRLWLGYSAASFLPDVEGAPTPPTPPFAAVTHALELPMAHGTLPGDPTLGLVLASPGDQLLFAHLPRPETPQFPWLSDHAQAIDAALSLGVELGRGFQLGAGLRALAGLAGDVDVTSVDDVPVTAVDDRLALNVAPIVGVRYQTGQSAWGLVYRGALEATFDVDVRVRQYGALQLPPLRVAGSAHYDPEEIGIETARHFGSTLLRFGLVYARWSAFDGWLPRSIECPPAEACGSPPAERVELSDTLSPRLGLAHPLRAGRARFTLRAGYAFDPTPLAEQTALANRWDNSKSVLSAGYGIELSGVPVAFDLSYQWIVLHPREHTKAADQPEAAPRHVRVDGNAHFVGVTGRLEY